MSSTYFQIIEHTCPCQHIREYPRGTKLRQEDSLYLAIKQYKPLLEPRDDAVTIIAAHANGFPKEAYEPLWDDLLKASKEHGFTIRGIWIADMSNQGASGILNEHIQGDDPSYFDHSRDMLSMINMFREHMPRPIVGIGHSFGATQLSALAIIHPRLFTSLVSIEPMIQTVVPKGGNVAWPSSYRKDLWPNSAAAESAFRKNRFFAKFDKRVLENIIEYGLRKTPTAVYPRSEITPEGSVTLTTTKHQEVWSFLRPNFEPRQPTLDGGVDPGPSRAERLYSPDLDFDKQRIFLFYRPEIRIAFEYLPFLRPSVLYMAGAQSVMSGPETNPEKIERTGIGLGGSGGVKSGQVEQHVFEDAGHMLPFEKTTACAEVAAEWLSRKLGQFQEDEQFHRNHSSGKSDRDMLVLSNKWMKMVHNSGSATRPFKTKL